MRHICDRCGYEWLDTVPSPRVVNDLCGVCSVKIDRARQRVASGYYDRREVIEATAARVADAMEKDQ